MDATTITNVAPTDLVGFTKEGVLALSAARNEPVAGADGDARVEDLSISATMFHVHLTRSEALSCMVWAVAVRPQGHAPCSMLNFRRTEGVTS